MKTIFQPALAAGVLLALGTGPAIAAPAPTPAPAPAAAQAIAVADLNAVIGNSNAVRAAGPQRQSYFKPQIDRYTTRAQQLQAQIKPLADKLQRDAAAPGASQAALQPQIDALQRLQQSAQNELNTIIKPAVYSEAYVTEQVEDKLDQAVASAMTTNRITLLLNPQAIIARQNANDLTSAVLAEINVLVPSAQLVPPAGWEPRQIREQRAQQAAAAGGQPPAAVPAGTKPKPPAGPQPEGR